MTDKKKPRTYSSANRLSMFRQLVFTKIIQPRILEELTWEQIPKIIADALNVQVSRGRGVRKLLMEWEWLKYTPSRVEVTRKPYEEFEAS